MDLIPNDCKYLLRTYTFHKSILKTFYYNNKGTRKVRDLQKLSNKEIYLSMNLIVLSKMSLSNSFHDQTSLKETIFSVLKSGTKL